MFHGEAPENKRGPAVPEPDGLFAQLWGLITKDSKLRKYYNKMACRQTLLMTKGNPGFSWREEFYRFYSYERNDAVLFSRLTAATLLLL